MEKKNIPFPPFQKFRLDSGVDEQKAKGQPGKEAHGQQAGAHPEEGQAQ